MKRTLFGPVVLIAFLMFWAYSAEARIELTSVGGFRFDIMDDSSGELSDGTSDAYDGCYYLSIDGEEYYSGVAGILDRRTVTMATVEMARSLNVSRSAYVPELAGDYIRYYDTIENTGATATTVEVSYYCNFGSDGLTEIWGTSSGDTTVDLYDYWFGSDDDDGSGDPSLAHAYYGEAAEVTPTSYDVAAGESTTIFSVTIEPGETVAFLIFGVQTSSQRSARTEVETIVADVGSVVSDLDARDVARVVNWIVDHDLDGFTRTDGDCDDNNKDVYPMAPELCDGLDNDCDEDIDEELERTTFYRDLDGDEYGDDLATIQACVAPPNYTSRSGDCDDDCVTCNPDAIEICDELDNNCNDLVDEGLTFVYLYRDSDGDGFGNIFSEDYTCEERPGWVETPGDCNDRSVFCNPDAAEICDDLDNDCNGEVDEGLTFVYLYRDSDGDGFGNIATEDYTCEDRGPGWVRNSDDCNDSCATCHFGATEICDELDNNCNGLVDEGLTVVIWSDADGDGYGNPPSAREACDVPEGYVENGDDCHDLMETINPAAEEVCDGHDNNCDGNIDEGLLFSLYYRDRDEDGYGDPETVIEECEQPEGFVDNSDDCDDGNAEINPHAEEIVDGVDNDCDGEVDHIETDGDADGDGDGDVDGDVDGDGDADADADGDSVLPSPPNVDTACTCTAAAPTAENLNIFVLLSGWLISL